MTIIEKAVLSLIVLVFSCTTPYCQDRCGVDIILREIEQERPTLMLEYEESFRDFYRHAVRNAGTPECPIIIPVHIIILHNPDDEIGEGTNLSEERILSQLEVLNQDFSRTNPDKDLTPPEFSVGDTGIRFYMACVDPDGNPTSGITRYPLSQNYNIGEEASIRNIRTKINEKTGWDRDLYLNIWVAPTLDVLGFSKVPTQTFRPNWNDDGVKMLTDVFGGPGYVIREDYNLGRTLTHEVGHFFGLGHIWRSNGCTLDDGIADTPLQNGANTGCPSHPSYSCGNEGDMFMNYMDYTNDACVNAFTQDQGAYMRTILNTSRIELSTSAGYACPEKLIIEMQTVEATDPTCHGGDDGIIEVIACGGANEDYKYAINGGTYSTDPIFTGLDAGNHVITVKNLFGITGKIEVILNDPDPSFVNEINAQSPICFGTKTGSISINSIDDSDLLYSIDGANFSDKTTFDELEAGSYTVYIKSPLDCIQKFRIEVAPPDKLGFTINKMELPSCYGNADGTITVLGQGGSLPYTYSMDGINFQSDASFANLPSGSYSIFIRDSYGCTFNSNHMLLEPSEVIIDVSEVTSIGCNGNNEGELALSVSGGTGQFLTSLNNGTFGDVFSYGNLASGNYTFRVQDENGCITETEYTLEEPEPFELIGIDVLDVVCVGDENGRIDIKVQGGTPGYSFTVNDKTQSIERFENLDVGIYNIYISDANGCEIETQVELNTQSEITLDILEVYAPSCYGQQNGKALVKATGGRGTYTYSMDNENFQDSPSFTNLKGGKNLIYIKDENSCIAASTITIPEASKIEIVNLQVKNPTCETINDGFIEILSSGGYGKLITKINGTPAESADFAFLENGTYYLEIIDENFCKADTLVKLDSPPGIEIELLSITDTNCEFNLLGSAAFAASGGTNNLEFSVDDKINKDGFFENLGGGRKTLLVNDDMGCFSKFEFEIPVIGGLKISLDRMIQPKCFDSNDGSIFVNATGGQKDYSFILDQLTNSNGVFESLYGGIHKIKAEDHYGCVGELAVQLDSPGKIQMDTVFLREPVCFNQFNGIIDADASGGKSPILYSLGDVQNYSGVFTGLQAGIHPIQVIDGNGCKISKNILLNQPEKIKATNIELISPSCFGKEDGEISFDVKGGKGKKVIYYRDQIFDQSFELSGLKAGNYRVRMSDQNKCNELLDIFLEEPAPLISNDTTIIPETYQQLGELTVDYSGGTKPYLFALNNGNYVSENTFNELIAGDYTFHVLDAHNCTDIITITVPYDDTFENPDGTVSDIWISHNPSNQNHLHFKLHGDQQINVKIFSVDGKIVYSASHELTDGIHSLELPTNNYASGTYLLRFDALRDYKNLIFVKN